MKSTFLHLYFLIIILKDTKLLRKSSLFHTEILYFVIKIQTKDNVLTSIKLQPENSKRQWIDLTKLSNSVLSKK